MIVEVSRHIHSYKHNPLHIADLVEWYNVCLTGLGTGNSPITIIRAVAPPGSGAGTTGQVSGNTIQIITKGGTKTALNQASAASLLKSLSTSQGLTSPLTITTTANSSGTGEHFWQSIIFIAVCTRTVIVRNFFVNCWQNNAKKSTHKRWKPHKLIISYFL